MTETATITREKFLLDFAVSREATAKFDCYVALLGDWQTRMNLVAPSTLPQIWSRHFYDSAQLFPLLPAKTNRLADIGAGAGFPGMVLALLAADAGRAIEIHLVESIQKKAAFLHAVAEALELPVIIHATRTEQIGALPMDVVTARALAGLPDLFRLVQPFKQSETVFFFLKGAKAAEELTEAHRNWHFTCQNIPSRTDSSGHILRIEQLRHTKEGGHLGRDGKKKIRA